MVTVFVVLVIALWKFLTYPFEPLARFVCRKEKDEEKRDKKEFVCLLICLIVGYAILKSPDMVYQCRRLLCGGTPRRLDDLA